MFDWVFLPQMFLYYLLFIGIIIILRKRKIPWLYTFSIACLCVIICSDIWEIPIHIESWLNGTFEWKYVAPKLLAIPLLWFFSKYLLEWKNPEFWEDIGLMALWFIIYFGVPNESKTVWGWLTRIVCAFVFIDFAFGFVSVKYDLWVKTFNDKDAPQKKTQKTRSKQTNNQN